MVSTIAHFLVVTDVLRYLRGNIRWSEQASSTQNFLYNLRYFSTNSQPFQNEFWKKFDINISYFLKTVKE